MYQELFMHDETRNEFSTEAALEDKTIKSFNRICPQTHKERALCAKHLELDE